MTKVYQTIFNSVNGNCLAAVWATLLQLPLENVPNFVEQDDYFGALCDFIRPYGYEYSRYLVNGNRPDLTTEERKQYEYLSDPLPDYGHINGYYDAVVLSPGLSTALNPVCHAVIVDKHLNIVHDPNPRYKDTGVYPMSDVIGYNGILGVSLYTKISTQ